MSFSSTERARLAALLHKLGPQAPTLCEGWTTRDLAAHLWVREHRPDAAAGMFLPTLASRLESVTEEVLRRDYDDVVDAWAAGPGKFNPIRYVDSLVNTAENFVHHEDVRRANGEVGEREFSREVQRQFAAILNTLAPRMLRSSRLPVVLHPEGLPRVVAAERNGVARDGGAVVRVHGSAAELVLWCFGREPAHVTVVGDAEAIIKSSL